MSNRLTVWVSRHRWRIASLLVVGAALLTFAVVYFAPQDLLINTLVNEPLPTAHANSPTARLQRPTTAKPAILRRGRFSSGEHETTGTALLLRLADGRTFIRLQDLSTSNGPAVRVWLTGAAAPASNAAVEAARHLDLGGL